jgi:predicted 3-demethylubiquinone-9 3-methyltransferase (glyoxalase superfamily)
LSKLTTCLWFDDQAEEAANFYVATFKACGQDAALGRTLRYSEAGPRPAGSVLTVEFRLAGQPFVALNGGPDYTFSPAVSLMVNCADQAEVDRFWDKLLEGGEPIQCGWLKDRFGFCWQILPTALWEMHHDADPAAATRVMRAMFKMQKLDLATLQAAYDQAG